MPVSGAWILFSGDDDRIITYLLTQPFPPNREGPFGAFFPALSGAGFRSYTGAGKAYPKDL